MGKDRTDSEDKEYFINFALLIQQIRDAKGIRYRIESQNQGIPDSEIILIVEAWLERIKENFKGPIREGLSFGKPDE